MVSINCPLILPMVAPKTLNPRHQTIFRATVNHYISTAEPVGSRTLLEEYGFQISSATIRNVMGQLEKAGFLYQPHISAGRIPSDSGYRLYVDELVVPDENCRNQASQTLQQHHLLDSWGLERTLQSAAEILASLSGYIALITMPHKRYARLCHLQLLPLGEDRMMVVVVTDSYQPHSFPVSFTCDQAELISLSNFLNYHLQGLSLQDIAELDLLSLDDNFRHCQDLLMTIFDSLNTVMPMHIATPIVVRGISEVLRQPEFAQIDQLQTLLHLIEAKQEELLPVLVQNPPEGIDTMIHIGQENPLAPMQTCTLITTQYYRSDQPLGSVALLGPTRMLYENAIALVEATADFLSATNLSIPF